MAEKIIQLKEVTKQYGKAIVLDHVSVDFEGGKIHGIVEIGRASCRERVSHQV